MARCSRLQHPGSDVQGFESLEPNVSVVRAADNANEPRQETGSTVLTLCGMNRSLILGRVLFTKSWGLD